MLGARRVDHRGPDWQSTEPRFRSVAGRGPDGRSVGPEWNPEGPLGRTVSLMSGMSVGDPVPHPASADRRSLELGQRRRRARCPLTPGSPATNRALSLTRRSEDVHQCATAWAARPIRGTVSRLALAAARSLGWKGNRSPAGVQRTVTYPRDGRSRTSAADPHRVARIRRERIDTTTARVDHESRTQTEIDTARCCAPIAGHREVLDAIAATCLPADRCLVFGSVGVGTGWHDASPGLLCSRRSPAVVHDFVSGVLTAHPRQPVGRLPPRPLPRYPLEHRPNPASTRPTTLADSSGSTRWIILGGSTLREDRCQPKPRANRRRPPRVD